MLRRIPAAPGRVLLDTLPPSSEMTERTRLEWRCRRGLLELDLLLQQFIDQQYDALSELDRRNFELLLTYPDQELLQLVMGEGVPEDTEVVDVVRKIRSAFNH